MLLWNYSVIQKSPWRFMAWTSVSNVQSNFCKNWQRIAVYSAESVPDQWWLPVGYSSGWMLPRKAWYVVAYSENQLSSTANPVMWVNGNGTCDVVVTALWNLSLVVSSNGTCSIVVTAIGEVIGSLTASWTSEILFTANWTIGANAFGTWISTITVTPTAVISALGHMTGEMNPFTPLSPEWLANAVWSALATENNIANTMGAKLNTASSGWVDMNALAQAVWEYATRTLTSWGTWGGATPEEIWEYTNRTLTSWGGIFMKSSEYDFNATDRDNIKKALEKLNEIEKKEVHIPEQEEIDFTPILNKIDEVKQAIPDNTEIIEKLDYIEDFVEEEVKDKEEEEKRKEDEEKQEIEAIKNALMEVDKEDRKNIIEALKQIDMEHEENIINALNSL